MNSSDHALLITLAVLFGLALAASCGLGCAAVRRHVTVQDGHPAVVGTLDNVPPRHYGCPACAPGAAPGSWCGALCEDAGRDIARMEGRCIGCVDGGPYYWCERDECGGHVYGAQP